jgi:hypothetical protein
VIGIAVIGLGNALQPHARSLVDLADPATDFPLRPMLREPLPIRRSMR